MSYLDSGIRCRVCERGVLIPRRRFRMSGPVVVIGFILLVPSVLGIIAGLLGLILSASAATGSGAQTVTQSPVATEAQGEVDFRRNCATSGEASYRTSLGRMPPPGFVDRYCDCALLIVKRGGSIQDATQSCAAEAIRGGSGPNTIAERPVITAGAGPNILGLVLGGGVSIGVIIASFVGGLLGWLLVMRKSVLQCGVCSAVVSTS